MLPLSGGELMTLRRGTVVEIRMEVPAHTTESNFYIPVREAGTSTSRARLWQEAWPWVCGSSHEFEPWLLGMANIS